MSNLLRRRYRTVRDSARFLLSVGFRSGCKRSEVGAGFSRLTGMPCRRAFMTWAASAVLGTARTARGAAPQSDDLEQHDLRLDGDAELARRALVLVPKQRPADAELPLLILLHGLGETGNELLGIHAWGERYGLVRAHERLRRPPVARELRGPQYLSDERIAELNASLGRRPYRGLVIACPVTPNPYRLQPAPRTLDRYAQWLEKTLIPAVQRVAPVRTDRPGVGLDGCSLGGYVGLEVFLRRPGLFGSFGTVQGAFGVSRAPDYAARIAGAIRQVGPTPIHLETSTEDPYHRAQAALSKELRGYGVPHTLCVPRGPHNQPWLREVGTLEMLLWHSRQLGVR